MGRVASSSKIKSSKKKKSSKLSNEALLGRRSKKVYKSKKQLSRDDDSSSYSDDDSSSSTSFSSSTSSEENYKSRKARSRKKQALQRSRSKTKHRDLESREKEKFKKRRQYDNISSTSSSSEESEFQKGRGRSRKRRKEKGKIVGKKRKNRSLSCSSLSRLSDAGNDNVPVNPTRLRSVIMVAQQAEEKDEIEGKKNDEIPNDEIVYEHDDYPSRSNESNDFLNKLDLDSKKETASGATSAPLVDGSSDSQNIETLLRQKALENLRRFKEGKSQTNDDSVLVSTEKLIVPELSKDFMLVSRRTEENILDEKQSFTQAEGVILGPGPSLSESSLLKARVESLEAGENTNIDGRNRGIESISESSLSISRLKGSFKASEIGYMGGKNRQIKQGSSESEPNFSKLSLQESEGASEIKILQDSEYESNISRLNKESIGVTDGGVMAEPTSEELHASSEGQNQVKDTSQFQQKTMSVMRGGAMVQVNYEVYIPKKPPGLARRRLRR